MLVEGIEEVRHGGRGSVRAAIRSDRLPGGVFHAELTVEGVDGSIGSTAGDALLAGLVLPAMRLGEPLELAASVSARLLERVPEIMAIYRAWSGLRAVEVSAAGTVRTATSTDSAQLFSAGVDSFYSLHRALDGAGARPPSYLIFVNGFDIPLGNPLAQPAIAGINRVATSIGAQPVVVTTNLRYLSEPMIDWGLYHGSLLAAVSLLFGQRASQCVIPASHAYQYLTAWGSHPLLDPMWSTEALELVHHGCDATREQKVECIGAEPLVHHELRVCLQPVNGTHIFNCGRCKKCVTTMLMFRLHRRLAEVRTFPPLELEHVQRLRLVDVDPDVNCLLSLAQQSNDRAVRSALMVERRRQLRRRWRRHVFDALRAPLRGRGEVQPGPFDPAPPDVPEGRVAYVRWRPAHQVRGDQRSPSYTPSNAFLHGAPTQAGDPP